MKRWTTYQVKAGKHRSTCIPRILIKPERLKFRFRVDETWVYLDGINAQNKIAGFSEGHHHKGSSYRLTVKVKGGEIYLGGYCWIDKIRPTDTNGQKHTFIRTEIGRIHTCEITRQGAVMIFKLDGAQVWKIAAGDRKRIGYRLNPYVGGTETAKGPVFFEIEF